MIRQTIARAAAALRRAAGASFTKRGGASSPPPTPNESPSLEERVVRTVEGWSAPFSSDAPSAPPRSLFPFFIWSFRGLGWPLALLVVVSLALGFIEVAVLAGVGELVDRANASAPDAFFFDNGWFLAGLTGLVLVIRPLFLSGGAFLSAMMVGPALSPGVIWRLHRHLLGQPMRYFEDDFAGRLTQKEMQAANAVDVVTIELINVLGLLIGYLLGMAVVLAAADPRLGLFVVLWCAGYALILRRLLPKVRASAARRAEMSARVSGQLVDAVSNIKTVKLFAASSIEEAAAAKTLAEFRRARIELGAQVTQLRMALNVMNGVAMVVLLAAALILWSAGAASIGAVAAAAVLTVRLTHMSGWIAFTLLGVFREIGTLEDAIGTLAKPHAITETGGARAAPTIQSAAGRNERICFENVSFSYDARANGATDAPAALHDISFTLEPGEKLGLVGPSGAGKSTLTALLLRLYDLESGRITLGGVDIRDLKADDLRARIGLVTQEPALFNRSALDNIRYGRSDASLEEVAAAAKFAGADDFIQGLADNRGRTGYAAHLGERGVKLSGGQRQRIALSRAFLKNAPILILDEATSALDSEIEAAILEAMNELMDGKTVLAIAHRLSTLSEMDRIIVLDEGRIVEQGDHTTLSQQNGLYAALWSRQSGGFLALEDTLKHGAADSR